MQMASCHTGRIDGYVIEGHVPVAVPGMPYGSPGMGPESKREAYDVHLIRTTGETEVFTRYEAA